MKRNIEQIYNEKQSTKLNSEQSNKKAETSGNCFMQDTPTEFLLDNYIFNNLSKEYSLNDKIDDKGLESCLSLSSNSESYNRSISQNDSQINSNFMGTNMNKSETKIIIVG